MPLDRQIALQGKWAVPQQDPHGDDDHKQANGPHDDLSAQASGRFFLASQLA